MYTRGKAKKGTEDINMDDKEATPVEDPEEIIPPSEPEQPKQPEKPTQTGDTSLQEIMRVMMENNQKTEDSQKKMEETLKKNIESLKEDLNKKLDDNSKTLKEDRVVRRIWNH